MISDLEHIAALHSADAEYRFGKPKTYLSDHELARLVLLRSRLGETRVEREAETFRDAPRNPKLGVSVTSAAPAAEIGPGRGHGEQHDD
jgi:hypothetical protein